MRSETTPRGGLTLVELLVTVILIAVLATIVFGLGPRLIDSKKVNEGAAQLQKWLGIARMRAYSERRPHGIRILDVQETPPANWQPVGVNPKPYQRFVTSEFQYIEQPDPIYGTGYAPWPNEGTAQDAARFCILNQAYKYDTSNPDNDVTSGDVLVLPQFNERRQIRRSPFSPTQNPTVLQLDKRIALGGAMLGNPNDPDLAKQKPSTRFEIHRRARPLAGEQVLRLPRDVIMDTISKSTDQNTTVIVQARTSPQTDNTSSGASGGVPGHTDILFAPSGEVIGPLGSTGRICLWLHDRTLDDPGPAVRTGGLSSFLFPTGDNLLVVIHTRTGQVTVHPVDTDPTTPDPYRFASDGSSSGVTP